MPRPTPLQRAYAGLSRLALPFALRVERKKLQAAEYGQRFGEKQGRASITRPAGRVIWFHAASVGESLSVLSLITHLAERLPDSQFLITSGTVTSADLIAKRLPPRSHHQFAPLDAPGPVRRFLTYWQPNAVVFVESELWPNMLRCIADAGYPMALLNARMSERSAARWSKTPATARALLSGFQLILTQNESMAQTMAALGANSSRIVAGVNLKSMSTPLPVDADAATAISEALAGRPVWVASSTHAEEEEIVLEAHKKLLETHPDLCLLLAPRHPDRSDDVASLIKARGWPDIRRSAAGLPRPDAPVYLADTLGELGTWYALTDIVFLGGSLRAIGGHNPFEVAQAGAVILSGQHVTNFQETYDALTAHGGPSLLDSTPEALATAVRTLLVQASTLEQAKRASAALISTQTDALDRVAQQLMTALDLAPDREHV